MCVVKKHAGVSVCIIPLENLHKHSLQLTYNSVKILSMLASLARAWLSKPMRPCKSTLRHCGCVAQSQAYTARDY